MVNVACLRIPGSSLPSRFEMNPGRAPPRLRPELLHAGLLRPKFRIFRAQSGDAVRDAPLAVSTFSGEDIMRNQPPFTLLRGFLRSSDFHCLLGGLLLPVPR
jgi:hypothetical protein